MLIGACLVAPSMVVLAQHTPTVTDADIAQARRSQPTVTEQDLDQARRTHPMPSEADLARVPISASPRIEALPQPRATAAIDLEALAKGYAAQIATGPQTLGLASGPSLMVFISLSMPEATLQRLVKQAARAKASILIRGLSHGSLRDTVARVQSLIGQQQVAIQIHPQAFERYAIERVPSFVLVREGARLTRTTDTTGPAACVNGSCASTEDFARVSGDVSLGYALEHIQRRAPSLSKQVGPFLQRLKG